MKKFLCVILLLSCLLGVCSCGTVNNVKNKITGDDEEEEVDAFTKFENAIASGAASATTVEVITKTGFEVDLSSTYEIFYNEDGSAVINYTYQRLYEFGEGPEDELVKTTTGVVYRNKDGSFSQGGMDLSAVAAAEAFKISVLKATAVINDAGDVLTVTIPKTSTEAVLGSQFSSDVVLEMILVGESLASMTLTYQDGKITYNYSAK